MPSSCGSVQSTRLAFPCFPRPRFELGLSSRVPKVSAKRARQPCAIRLVSHPSQRRQPWPVNTISIVAILRMSDHHASALGASSAVHCTDHVVLDECEALSTEPSLQNESKRSSSEFAECVSFNSDSNGFPEVCCCTFCHKVDSSSMNSLC